MEKLKSRKFWMAVISALILVANDGLGWELPAETILSFAAVVIGWIFAEAYVDGKREDCSDIVIVDSSDIE